MALTDPIIQFQKERASVPFQPPTKGWNCRAKVDNR